MTYHLTISIQDIDPGVLSPSGLIPGTPEFSQAVSDFLIERFEQVIGHARVLVDSKQVSVEWSQDADAQEPFELAVGYLQQGDYECGIALLRLLRLSRKHNIGILFNLGMALSDKGELTEAMSMLREACELDPTAARLQIALGVAMVRSGQLEDGIAAFRKAAALDPEDPYAQRNLGGALLKSGGIAESMEHFKAATQLAPGDVQAWYGLAQAQLAAGENGDADLSLIKVIELDPYGSIGETARQDRSRITAQSFRSGVAGNMRPDAVMYCLGALEKFADLPPEQVRTISFEIALLGRSALDTNNSDQKYTLKSMPGKFSGLHLLSFMYVGFKQVAPELDVGFDLAREYAAAAQLFDRKA